MANICEVAGLGRTQSRHRDGLPGYHLTEAPVSDDAKGVGPPMMCRAALEALPELHMPVGSARIMCRSVAQ